MFAEFAKKLNKAKKWCALGVVVAFFALPATVHANAQFTPAELDTLVSTIALYPDPLLVQVLAASVHGDEIPGASDWANQHKNLKGEELAERIRLEELPYDESVQALIPFPTVLATMAKYQVWTDQLGDAVASQKEAVMDAVQRMRSAAYSHGHLQSNEQVKVIKEKTIVIEPVQKEYVYVPVYNPHVVYYVYSNGYPGLHYRTGVWIGGYYDYWGWGTSRFEWDSHLIYVHDYRWYHNRPRPHQPTRYHNPPPPGHDYHAAPTSRPAKVPMNHHNAPRQGSNALTPQAAPHNSNSNADIQRAAATSRPIMSVKQNQPGPYAAQPQPYKAQRNVSTESGQNSSQQDDYWQQNSRSQNTGFGKTTATRSTGGNQRNANQGSRNGNRGGFGKSVRK